MTNLLSIVNPRGMEVGSEREALTLFRDVVDKCRVSNGGAWPDDGGAPILMWVLSKWGCQYMTVLALDMSVLYPGIAQFMVPGASADGLKYLRHVMYSSDYPNRLYVTHADTYVHACIKAGWSNTDAENKAKELLK